MIGGAIIGSIANQGTPAVAVSSYVPVAPISITISTAGTWIDYDLFTLDSIPKGAVVELFVCNNDVTDEYEAGARNDGSSIIRKLDVMKAEATDGVAVARMLVTCDASTGKIELYAEDTTAIEFRIFGYWTGMEFTERFDEITVGSTEDDMWTEINLNTDFSTPISRVYDICHTSIANSAAYLMGSREKGSSLVRSINLQQAEGGGISTFNMFVKADSSGIYETFIERYDIAKNYSMGYWDDTVDYTERFDDITPSVDATWEDQDLTAYVTSPLFSEVLFSCGGVSKGDAQGVRKNGDATVRTIIPGVVMNTNTPKCGLSVMTLLDADDIIENYSADVSEVNHFHVGYFK